MALITINRGMGMYPTNEDGTPNPCYDPNRPSWLPYWLDTWNEGKCFYLPGGAGGTTLNPDVFNGGNPNTPTVLDQTVSSLMGIALIVGVAYLFLGLYWRKGRY